MERGPLGLLALVTLGLTLVVGIRCRRAEARRAGARGAARLRRLWRPRTPDDCPACRAADEACSGRFADPSALRGAPIRVVEATEHRECPYIAYPSHLHRGGGSVARDVLAHPLMRPVLVERGHVLPEH